MPEILYEKRNRIAYITLNRPEAMNSMNSALNRQFREALYEFRDDPEILVGIVTGAGDKAFCAGMDLKERNAANQGLAGPPVPSFLPEDVVWKPMIAAINGFCLAGGLERALTCDIRIAAEHATFGLPEPRWSLTASYGLHNLSRMIPLGEALYIQLTGERINAQEALRIGLVHKVVPLADLMAEAEKVAESIKLCAPLAVSAIKQIVMTCRNLPVEYSYKFADSLAEKVRNSEDSKEGPRAFAEKRAPQWKGR